MKEDQLIGMVMGIETRVERLESAMFTREEKDRLFNSQDFLMGGFDTLKEELTLNSFRLNQLQNDMVKVKDNLTILNSDMSSVKSSLGILNNDMEKMKVKLGIT